MSARGRVPPDAGALPRRRRLLGGGAAAAALAASGLPGCGWLPRPAGVPLPVREDRADCGAADTLLVLLPGRGMALRELAHEGFVQAWRAAGVRADLWRVDAHQGYYRDRSIVDRLHADIVQPARARGYGRIWLAGISLGGLGALLYAHAHPQEVAGLLLIAPYLGEAATAADVAAQGGPARWTPPQAGGDAIGLRAWGALKHAVSPPPGPTPLYLAFGVDDRLAPTHRVLAEALPPQRVMTAAGGHDWPAWRPLWRRLLAQAPLPRCG
ncbi:alpha/beta hydrolase [Xenophilus sp. Marseille-Q4582]|uniref:alpha/beta hydrolase n=1 Tax=Xenophilus sp. Marseille-Q4582 TaxID=2866600 RepID=UPI001CE3D329|nr:alpha/beta hydrolase [Xenophilus sp. Marseille-Q4582]